MKVKAKITYPQLEGIFKKGDELEITTEVYERDVVIVNAIHGVFKKGTDEIIGILDMKKYIHGGYGDCEVRKIFEPVIAQKGSFKEALITNAEGKTYSMTTIKNAIGYRNSRMGNLFIKL